MLWSQRLRSPTVDVNCSMENPHVPWRRYFLDSNVSAVDPSQRATISLESLYSVTNKLTIALTSLQYLGN